MKTVNVVEGIAFTEDMIEQLQYLQDKELLAHHIKNAMNLTGFLVVKLDFDEPENRNYITWLHFLNDMMTFLQSLESSAKNRKDKADA